MARDFGFAPNPFFRFCTLATCKPKIRKHAQVEDWIVGTGSAKNTKRGYLVFAMCVTEIMSFNGYWNDPRFQKKKPNLCGSLKQAFGDNIYLYSNNFWRQENSHHSYEDGSPNVTNIDHDTQTDRLLISDDYVYFGGSGPIIPTHFRNYRGYDICAVRGHKNNYPEKLINDFVVWIRSLGVKGYISSPIDWD